MIPQLHFLCFCLQTSSTTINSSLCQTLGPRKAVSFYFLPLQTVPPTRWDSRILSIWREHSRRFKPKRKLRWGVRGIQAGILCWFFFWGVAVVSLTNPCYICCLGHHIHQTRSGLRIKCFSVFLSFLSVFHYLLLFSVFCFFNFAIHKTKVKGTPQNTDGVKGQRSCFFHPSSPFPILSFCLQQLAVLTGLPCFPLLFFSLALGKPANAPKRGQNFPFIQLIFTRNPINNTWHFNKTLSEWFDEKQIHYVRSQ